MGTAPKFENIVVSVDDNIGELLLNRPEKLNPLGPRTLMEIAQAAEWFDDNESVKVVVVRGAGRAFSAGADLRGFSGVDPVKRRDLAVRWPIAWSTCVRSPLPPFMGGVWVGL